MELLTAYGARFGRLSRATWAARLFWLALSCTAAGMLAEYLFGSAGAALLAFIFAWCCGAISIQRLHDTGRSGWALLAMLIPVLGPLWLLFQLLREGDPWANAYGDNPAKHADYLLVDIAK